MKRLLKFFVRNGPNFWKFLIYDGLFLGFLDPNGTQCTSDLALFSYSFPSSLGLITEYDLFVHVPSNNQVNILNHMICAITSEVTCGTFTQE